MAQVFGNRILGGIGAPGGGMSEAFGAGANTALGQRESRQAMIGEAQRQRMLEQEFAWKGEDREEAKRRAAAAAAVAASAKARQDAMNAALMAGLRIPAAPVTALPSQGPSYPTPVAPIPGRPSLTFGGATAPVTGGGGTTVVGGGAGSDMLRGGGMRDRLGAPTTGPSFEQVGREVGAASIVDMANTAAAREAMAVPPGQSRFRPAGAGAGPVPAAAAPMTYSDFVNAARRGQRPTFDQLVAAVESGTLTGQQAADVQAMIESNYIPTQAEERVAMAPGVTPSQSYPPDITTPYARLKDYAAGVFGGRTIGEQAAIDAQVAQLAPQSSEAQRFRPAGAIVPGAAPAATAPAGPVAITMPDGTKMTFDTGTETQYPTAPQANLTFGPQLGAVADRPDLSVSMRVMGAASGQAVPPARIEQYVMTPVRVGAEMQEALSLREELVRRAGIYQEYNDIEGFSATLQQIGELDSQLVDLQTAQGLVDLQFNSPQRLEMALSAKTGWDIAVQPNPQGTFDIFVDGQLWQKMDRDQIGSFSQGLLDDAYAAKQAERAQQQFEAQLEIEKTIATEGIKTEYGMVLEAMKADRMTQELLLKAQLNPANTELVKSETDGMIHVYDKLAQQYVGYIDPQPIDPISGEALTQPLFVPYSQ